MENFLFTSESVAIGHPDKIADQISDAVLDACLEQDPESRVACETVVTSGLVFLAGEITTKAKINYQEIVRNTIREIGYHDSALGFDFRSCGIIFSINAQSTDISKGIDETELKEMGAGDQGVMYGYACDDTPELMPISITLANRIVRELKRARESKEVPFLKPDAKTQVTIEFSPDFHPQRVHTVVLSTQHSLDVDNETIQKEMITLIQRVIPKELLDSKTKYLINPSGRFVIGGPVADCGLTGRKTIVDTYGGMAHHGGGAFSGKDPTKVDRSGSYAARYVAKNIVAAKLAKRCEVQISYAIGIAQPIAIKVDTFGTSQHDEKTISQTITKVFDLTPKGIIQSLNLQRPIYKDTAFSGHFGREGNNFTWEKTDKVQKLIEALQQKDAKQPELDL